ncbi:MAG: acyl-CoA dehydrogenase [Pseudomonadota bacterium]
MNYRAPIADLDFIFQHILKIEDLFTRPRFEMCDYDMLKGIIHQADRFACEQLLPAYWPTEQIGAKLEDNAVIMPDVLKDIYQKFCAEGYTSISAPDEFGGMGLPSTVFTAVFEIISAAHMGFGLCPLLTQGAIHALEIWGSAEQKSLYLPKLISGEWTGTMNLTEPQAGSAVGDITTKAEAQSDGTYKIFGTKIYITYGDHDLAENIIHLVLARLPGAPAGTKGISLFLVPKFLVEQDGSLGKRNDVYAVGLEEKLGIHTSPTCTMKFGENDGAIGYLVGKENGGMRAMFTMMNDARLQVGAQGLAAAEIAYQKALAYAKERKQGPELRNDMKNITPESLSSSIEIIHHPDIQRQLLTIRVHNYISRLIVLQTAYYSDLAGSETDPDIKQKYQAYADFMTPIAKAFPTDKSLDSCSRAIQVFGGLGYVEETQIACHLRDTRITPIYEGTNGIQAIDFITRKIGHNEMAVFRELSGHIATLAQNCFEHGNSDLAVIGDQLELANDDFLQAGEWMYQKWYLLDQDLEALAGAEPMIELAALVIGGYLAAKGAYNIVTSHEDNIPEDKKIYLDLARFYAENILSQSRSFSIAATRGTEALKAAQNWF